MSLTIVDDEDRAQELAAIRAVSRTAPPLSGSAAQQIRAMLAEMVDARPDLPLGIHPAR